MGIPRNSAGVPFRVCSLCCVGAIQDFVQKGGMLELLARLLPSSCGMVALILVPHSIPSLGLVQALFLVSPIMLRV